VAVQTTATATTVAGGQMAAAGTVAQVAWVPFLLTLGAIAAAFIGIKLATDKLIANRKALLNDPNKIPSWSTGSNRVYNGTSMSDGSRPRMAKGGVITRATNVLAGEAGPEAIIPLHKMGMMGGVTIVNNIRGSVVSEVELATRVRDDIAQLMRRKGLNPSILGV
jgi:hypothetical protein